MANVTVTPEAFRLVFFEANEIKAAAEQAADDVGLPADAPIRVEVNESTPLGIVRITSLDPIVINADSGAFEDPKRPRRLSENYVKDVLSRSLYRITDRRSPGFTDAPDRKSVV